MNKLRVDITVHSEDIWLRQADAEPTWNRECPRDRGFQDLYIDWRIIRFPIRAVHTNSTTSTSVRVHSSLMRSWDCYMSVRRILLGVIRLRDCYLSFTTAKDCHTSAMTLKDYHMSDLEGVWFERHEIERLGYISVTSNSDSMEDWRRRDAKLSIRFQLTTCWRNRPSHTLTQIPFHRGFVYHSIKRSTLRGDRNISRRCRDEEVTCSG